MADNVSEVSSNLLDSERHTSVDSYAPRNRNESRDSYEIDIDDSSESHV